ncbi:MAG: peroxiredoxin [Candidatus Nanopelagicales bacterium]|nr:peroxiredoxin [Candidatus Nanopelagicales bacterium]
MLTIGDQFPQYDIAALIGGDLDQIAVASPDDYFTTATSTDSLGRWRVVFFWPKDFTFVCPTEIAEFGRLFARFQELNADVLGVSTDSEYVHYAWRTQLPIIKELPFPMGADMNRALTGDLGILTAGGVAQRATFIVNPDNVIEFVMVTAGSVGRNVEEVVRVLEALQTGELTPCAWSPGQATIDALDRMREK